MCEACDIIVYFFFFQAEDGIRDLTVTGVQTCALPILGKPAVGVITEHNVTVFWYPTSSMIVYAFKPTFKGQFADVDGRVFLRGLFTMTRFSKGHRVLRLPGIVIIGAFIIFILPVAALHHRSNPWELLLPMLGISLLGFEIWFAGLIERRWHR